MTSERKKQEEVEGFSNTADAASESPANMTVTWDDTKMQTSYANVINVINTREEFSLLFGTNQTWNLVNSPGFVVKLENRILLTPHAARRLQTLLTDRLAEYEKQCGPLNQTR